jgi:hypothetical protein
MAFISRRDDEAFHYVTAIGSTPETAATAVHFQKTFLDTRFFVVGRDSMTGRVLLEGRVLQITDLAADPEFKFSEAITVAKIRTQLGVPLLREGFLYSPRLTQCLPTLRHCRVPDNRLVVRAPPARRAEPVILSRRTLRTGAGDRAPDDTSAFCDVSISRSYRCPSVEVRASSRLDLHHRARRP